MSGLIVVPSGTDHSYLRAEVELGIPVVFMDRPGEGLAADQILLDNRGGARKATESLLAAGRRRIGVVLDSLEIFTMRERLAGIRDALDAAGIDPDGIQLSTETHTPEEARAVTLAMLDSDTPPTGLICGNNRSTIGAVEAVWSRGADVKIAGFDDFETSGLLPLAVTIVDYDARALGVAAAERLFARIAGDTAAPEEHLLPTELVSRGGGWPSAAA